MKIYCPACAALIGHLPGAEGLKKRFPDGCPFCNHHNVPDSTRRAYREVADKAGADFVDDQGNPVLLRQGTGDRHSKGNQK